MAETYYDITDLVSYLSSHGTVTGIQRVEVRLLAELAKTAQAGRSWCVAVDPRGRGYRAWRLDDVFSDVAQEGVGNFLRLVEGGGSRRWPAHSVVRRHLNRLGARGWRRTSLKLGIYAGAVISPASLERRGLVSAAHLPALSATRLARLPHGATLVITGAGWNRPAVSEAAALHARRGGRVVHCVHDLIPIVRPEYFKAEPQRTFARYMRQAAEHVTEFICVSRHTQADLHAFLTSLGRRIPSTVVPLAHEFVGYPRNARGCQPVDGRLRKFGEPGRAFLLCVGTMEVRKNGVALLDAWVRLRAELGDATPHLIFCGGRGWKTEPFFEQLAKQPSLREIVHIVYGAADGDLAFLHERSLGSIYPSLYEGWGLPVGEAAWFGRLCITSRNTSLPEVCGELADYVDPRNIAEITGAVLRATVDDRWRRHRERMIAGARLRTWRDVAADFGSVMAESGWLRRAA